MNHATSLKIKTERPTLVDAAEEVYELAVIYREKNRER